MEIAEPLIPNDVDLSTFPWIKIDIRTIERLAGASEAEFAAHIHLLIFSWHQIPASSIVNDDSVLCKAAGLGRDIRKWKAIKKKALTGFVECSDGRIYHAQLSKHAADSFRAKQQSKERKQAFNERKKNADGTRSESVQNGFGSLLSHLPLGFKGGVVEEEKKNVKVENQNNEFFPGGLS